MALTQISTEGIKDGTITGSDLATNVDLVDDQKLRFGTGNDLEIYGIASDGTAAIINHANGDLLIKHGADKQLISRDDGAIELYYDDSKKFETTTDGVSIPSDTTFLQIGAGQDLDLHHNGTNSYIRNKTGDLHIRPLVAEEGIILKPNAAVQLYYDNSLVFETVGGGVFVRGNLYFGVGVTGNLQGNDNDKLILGTGSDLQIYHDGSHSRIYNSTGNLTVRSAVFDVLNADGSERMMRATADGGCDLFFNGVSKLETRVGDTIFHDDIRIQDNNKINVGTGDDLQIYHDGSHSQISNSTGNLNISSGSAVVTKVNTSEDAIVCNVNGSVDLYYDNSKKLETDNSGVSITGRLDTTTGVRINADNQKLKIGAGDDLEIYHDGSNSYIKNAGTGNIIFLSDDVQFKSDGGGHTGLTINTDGAVELYHNNTKRFETFSAGAQVIGTFAVDATTGLGLPIGTDANEPNAANYKGYLRFNDDDDAIYFSNGTEWINMTATTPTLSSVSGNIFDGLTSNLTLSGTGFLSANLVVNFVQSSDGINANVTVTPSSDSAATVAVPSAVHGSVTAGNVVTIKVTNSDGKASGTVNKTASSLPSGGTITTSGGFRIHTFTSSGTFVNTIANNSVQYLVIGGGASGGNAENFSVSGSGGGGAGGYRSSVTGESSGGGASAESAQTLSAASFSVTVGGGGSSQTSHANGNNGSNSVFAGSSTITSLGGGAGGGASNNGSSGGSGGGGGDSSNGGAGTSGQGFAGANFHSGGENIGGGGGGAGAAATNANGGVGVSSSINGSATFRGGGGGGAGRSNSNGGSGGNGGGGAGTNHGGNTGTAGTANTGGGGGGTGAANGGTSGAGGSGIVILRYAI